MMIFVFFCVRTSKYFSASCDDLLVDLDGVDLHLRVVVLVEVDHGPAAEADDQHLFLLAA